VLHARNRRRRRNYFVVQRARQTIRSRRSLFVRLVSDSPTLCHLAGTSDSESTGLDVSPNFYGNAGRAQRVGNFLGKDDEHAGEQALPGKENSPRLDFERSTTKNAPADLTDAIVSKVESTRAGLNQESRNKPTSISLEIFVHRQFDRNPPAHYSPGFRFELFCDFCSCKADKQIMASHY